MSGWVLRKQYSCHFSIFFPNGLRGIVFAIKVGMNPKSLSITVIVALAFLGAVLMPTSSGGQTADEINMTQLLNDVTAQQVTIVDNQAKIDAKLAIITENVRQARIYSSRGK